ncbi:MAG: hypothetical protein WD066_03510 [Planctomycetaceae bacterium]
MRRRRERFLAAAFSTAMLAATIMPPAVGHAHSDGDRPHEHSVAAHDHGAEAAGHAHDHHGEACDHSHGPVRNVETAKSPPVAHRHVWFLFVEWTFPARDSQGTESDGPELPESIRISRLSDAGAVPSAATQYLNSGLPPALIDRLPAPATLAAQNRGERGSEALSLCDAARHECAGVLLI